MLVINGFLHSAIAIVRSLAVGNGGNITISSKDFSLTDGGILYASTSGQGNAGNVSVRATNSVALDDASILNTVESGGIFKKSALLLF